LEKNKITKANDNHLKTIIAVNSHGLWDKDDVNLPRGRYSDGGVAYSKQLFHVQESYSIIKGDFPITNIRSISPKSGIGEILWIYQDQTNKLSTLKEKYNVHWWDSWDIGDGTIGATYGEIVRKYDLMNRLLKGLVDNPYSKRHILSLWQEDSLRQTVGLPPCAFMTEWNIVPIEGKRYLSVKLSQRSSDYITANSINKLQYYALMLMVCGHLTHETGIEHIPFMFTHSVTNIHIYDRHFEKVSEMLTEVNENAELLSVQPTLLINGHKNFYDYTVDDFQLDNMKIISQVSGFDIAI
jgi:thymidylate synthase